MIDKEYIDSLLELPKREAKEAFVEYAQGFGIELKKNLTIEAMIEKFTAEIKALHNEPMPEETEGLTMSELLAQEDGRIVVQAAEPKVEPVVEETPEATIDPVSDEVTQPIETPVPVEETPTEAIQDQPVIESEELPPGFYPTLSLMGPAPGYTNIPYWIWDFIEQNKDWKSKIHTAREVDRRVLYSLLYYIKRQKTVQIRESRNSRFHILN